MTVPRKAASPSGGASVAAEREARLGVDDPRGSAELRLRHIDPSLIGPGHPYGDPGWCACPSCHDNCDHTPKENSMENPMIGRPWRKKPVVVRAVQLTEDNGGEVAAWSGGTLRGGPGGGSKGGTVIIDTLEGRMVADVGDYVIRGVKGEHYPCKPDIFEATYEPA